MASLLSEALPKFTAETLKLAAKQSERCHVVSDRLRRAIENYIREQEVLNMRRKVLSLSQSFNGIKEANLLLPSSTSKELVEDPLKAMERSQRWKLTTAYGDAGLRYQEDQAIAYVAARMPAGYSALYGVLSEVRRRVPDFAPAKVLDFGAGTGSALWAMTEVWPGSLEQINLVEPSQSMQRAGLSLLKDLGELPLIQSYDGLQSLTKKINKSGRQHDLVIASYVLGEVPSLQDRSTLVRQLWDLTGDILVLVEPGTPQGSKIINQMRSHILWMENRRTRKLQNAAKKTSGDLMTLKTGAFTVAPRSNAPLRGFEDENFCYVAFRRGTRPSNEPWPLDGMKFETLREMKANRMPDNLEIVVESQLDTEEAQSDDEYEEDDADNTDSNDTNIPEEAGGASENDDNAAEDDENEVEAPHADLGSGWGRIIYMPLRRGKRVELDICRSTNNEGTKGSFDRVVVTQSKNPKLHHQARRSIWGDLWPLRSGNISKYFM